MSKSKDASSKLHEKHQAILADLLRDEDNKYCADCMAKGPRWASWNLGVFMCIRCAGIHRNLGVHISRVKSVNLDSWTPEQIQSIQKGGNGRAKSIYEANLPANFRRPQDDYAVEQFIRAKYERKQYIGKGGSSESAPKESQEQKAKSKPKKATSNTVQQKATREQVLSVPRPGAKRSPSPQQPSKLSPSPSHTSSSSSSTSKPNLIALDSTSKKPSSQPQAQLDILTGLSPSTSSNPTPSSNAQATPSLMGIQAAAPSASSQPFFGAPQQPAMGIQPQQTQEAARGATKDSIMSLYGAQNQPQHSSYTAQGYPVNNFYYQQQQEAAMRMAHMAALQQHQVNQVTAQMQQIKVNQQQQATSQPFPAAGGAQPFPPGISNGGMGAGGQTLNPTLW